MGISTGYEITETCPEKIIVDLREGVLEDFSSCGSARAAWEQVKEKYFIDDINLDDFKEDFLSRLVTATPEDALDAAEDGDSWPLELGYVKRREPQKI